jgi:adenine/guanine/hypoxanthine permease
MGALQRTFGLAEAGTTVRTEVLAGATTFATMSYIIVVQPTMLSSTGMDFGAVMVATCVASAFATLLMGLYANLPIALAPAMGHNAFFAFTVCLPVAAGGMGYTWQEALGGVFVAGLAFLLLSAFRFRQRIIGAVPESLKLAIAAGIGLMIALLGFQDAGLAERGQGTLLRMGSLGEATTLIALIGLGVTAVLMARRVPGAILIGMAASAAICLATGLVQMPAQPVAAPPSLAPTLGKLTLANPLARPEFLIVIFTFFYLDLFDTVGTLIGVGERAGLMRDGELPRAGRALAADAAGTSVGALLGTSTVTSYIESCAGVATGGRTGLANVVTAALFLLALPLGPLVKALGGGIQIDEGVTVNPVTAPALIVVGCMMMAGARRIDWDDYAEALPAFLALFVMPVDMNISSGISAGFVSYVVLKVAQGKGREVPWLTYACGVLGVLYFAFLR